MKRIKLYNKETEKRRSLFASVCYELIQRQYNSAAILLSPLMKIYDLPEFRAEGSECLVRVNDDEVVYLRTYLAVSTSPEAGINRRLSRMAKLPANIGKYRLTRTIFALAVECPRRCLAKAETTGIILGDKEIQFELWESKDVRQQIVARLNIICPAFYSSHLEQLIDRCYHLPLSYTESIKGGVSSNLEDAVPESIGTLIISYADKDMNFVERLVSALDRTALKVWYDKRESVTSQNNSKLKNLLDEASSVVLVLSRNYLSESSMAEKLAVASQFQSKGAKILPVLIEDCEIPDNLRNKYADFRNSFERGVNELILGLQGRK